MRLQAETTPPWQLVNQIQQVRQHSEGRSQYHQTILPNAGIVLSLPFPNSYKEKAYFPADEHRHHCNISNNSYGMLTRRVQDQFYTHQQPSFYSAILLLPVFASGQRQDIQIQYSASSIVIKGQPKGRRRQRLKIPTKIRNQLDQKAPQRKTTNFMHHIQRYGLKKAACSKDIGRKSYQPLKEWYSREKNKEWKEASKAPVARRVLRFENF